MDKINEFRGKYYFLSNFYPAPLIYKGSVYQNNEAAFQAQKCISVYLRERGEIPFIPVSAKEEQFLNCSAAEAKRLGRKVELRPDWEEVKEDLMQEIVDAKFDQNPDLAEQLLKTGDIYLEEGNTWNDRTWGTVGGEGQNLLGKILMKTRERLEEQKNIEK